MSDGLQPGAASFDDRRDDSPYWLQRSYRALLFIVVALSAVGVYAFFRMPVAIFPHTNFPRIVIGVDNGVMPVEQMQIAVTKPIEDAVNSVPGLVTLRSTTSRGSADISLFFNWSVNMVQTLQLVDAALSQVRQTLPVTATITSRRLTFAAFPILGYSLTSNTLSQTQLWELATYTLKPPLNRVAGVSTVTVQGGAIPEFDVVPNLARLQETGVTLSDLTHAIESSDIVQSPGLYTQDHQLVLALVGAPVHDIDSLRQITIKTTSQGAPVRVGSVATVERGVFPAHTEVRANNQPAVLLNIARQPSSDTVAVAKAVTAEVAQLRAKLPPGTQLEPFYDQSQIVQESVRSVRDAILIGLVLACLILYLVLKDWRSSLIAGLVIPTTVAITVLVLWTLGESFNLMTLGGLSAAIGLVIDDAIVVVENIASHRSAGEPPASAVQHALRELLRPLIGSTLTPVVVFLPLVAVTGVTGSFFRALAVTMTIALLTSLALAVTFTPCLALLLPGWRANTREQPAADNLSTAAEPARRQRTLSWQQAARWQAWILDASLRRPIWLGVACLALAACAFLCYRSLGSDLLPRMDEGAFVVDYIMPPGSSLASTNQVLKQVHDILKATPEVESTSRRTGLQMGFDAVTEANTGDITVRLKQHRSRGIEAIMADVRARIHQREPGLDVEFTQVLQDNIGDLSDAPEPIQVKLFAQDPALLNALGRRVAVAIAGIPGVVDVENGVDNTLSGPATTFQVNSQLAADVGFTPAEIAEDTAAVLDGIPVNTPLIADGRPYTIRVRLGAESRRSLDTIRDTVFNSSTGHTASLGSMTQITQLPPQNEILRENLQRLVVVTGRLEGTNLGAAIQAVRTRVDAMHLPAAVHVEYGGTYQQQQRSFAELVRVLLLAFVLVFAVLVTEFQTFAAPTAILVSSLLSVAGVTAALRVTGMTFNVSSFMGMIMVVGIVAKNGILLLDAGEHFRRDGATVGAAMVMAAQRRLRPISMTALAATFGLLPLALAIGAGSQILQPLAIAVIGGISSSMLLSLIVTPAVYTLLLSRGKRS